MKITKRVFFGVLFALLLALLLTSSVLAQGEEPPIALPDITALTLGTIIAAVLSLLLDYFPGLAAWYDGLAVSTKRLLAAVFAVVIVGVVFGLTCTNVVTSNLVCTVAGGWDAVSNIIYVFVVGQGVHAGSKPTPAFKANVLKINQG